MKQAIEQMRNRTINGYDFEWVANGDDTFYQCRGEVWYDDEHDEIPERGLWIAACKLADELKKEGYNACSSHSEKGWCEVFIYNHNKEV